jgi:enoyl-CoA hydratase/carnithine racemase
MRAVSTDEVLYEVADGIATITLNRPDRMNAISGPMLEALSERLIEADRDQQVRCVVLTGAGRAFCAGLDLQAQASGQGLGSEESGAAVPRRGELDWRTAPPTVLHEVDVPVICALNGGAAGYGLDLALGCDIRIAAEGAKLAAAFAKRGILPESGGTWLLPRIVGYAKAAELCFTARTLSAKEALDLGLVTQVVSESALQETVTALAQEIAANAPLAVRATKRMLREAAEEGFEAHVKRVYLQLLPLFQTKDFREGFTSFLEKRPATFEGR